MKSRVNKKLTRLNISLPYKMKGNLSVISYSFSMLNNSTSKVNTEKGLIFPMSAEP
jgi:hypothetical protein